MERQKIQDLIKLYNAGTCSDYERALVEDWYLQFAMPGLNSLSDKQRFADLDFIQSRLLGMSGGLKLPGRHTSRLLTTNKNRLK